MQVVTSRPSAVHVRIAGRDNALPSPSPRLRTALDIVVRGFLIGEAIGMLLLSEGNGVISVTVVGILAIGMALVSWDR